MAVKDFFSRRRPMLFFFFFLCFMQKKLVLLKGLHLTLLSYSFFMVYQLINKVTNKLINNKLIKLPLRGIFGRGNRLAFLGLVGIINTSTLVSASSNTVLSFHARLRALQKNSSL